MRLRVASKIIRRVLAAIDAAAEHRPDGSIAICGMSAIVRRASGRMGTYYRAYARWDKSTRR